jgi:hypothetical protein
MYIYETPPVDYFSGLLRFEDALNMIDGEGESMAESLMNLLAKCVYTVSKITDWEGDICCLHLLAFPQEGYEPRLGLIWKQNNNGTTFICSPVAIPWFAEWEINQKGDSRQQDVAGSF